METDIGNPIDYNPTIDPLAQDKEEDTSKIDEQQYYFQSPEMNYQQPLIELV